jgi:Transposase DDE domain
MPSPIEHYVTSMEAFIDEAPKKSALYFVRPGKDFTRTRLLPFSLLVWHQVSLLNCSLSAELYNLHCVKLGMQKAPTKSGLSQARDKIKTIFFEELFKLSVYLFYINFEPHKWNGLFLNAVDGTSLRLPKKQRIGNVMGWTKNQFGKSPQTRVLAVFDVLNKIILDAELFKPDVSEAKTAYRLISGFSKAACYIYDRGFGSQITLALHLYFGVYAVTRMRTDIAIVKDFIASGALELIVTQQMNSDTRENLISLGLDPLKLDSIKFRLIRVELENGEIEVLATTMMDEEVYPAEDFKELYNHRWAVETCFYILKSYMQLLNFSCFKEDGCKKEILHTLIFYNMQSAMIFSAKEEVATKYEDREYEYQVNRNVSICFQRDFIHGLIKKPVDIAPLVKKLIVNMVDHVEPIRPDAVRAKVRKPDRHKSGRHFTQTNYRQVI